ncbi:hypothetical protein [Paraburkholderia sp. CNPSo 3272]|uniref:hypothetical protein n=1 Tax=Paraburkholderia sp. CNPSo 3272 TaxID=2940931 RepID=UPI0035CD1DA0
MSPRNGFTIDHVVTRERALKTLVDAAFDRLAPMRGRIHARTMDAFPDYIRHSGEEFLFLLRGEPELSERSQA